MPKLKTVRGVKDRIKVTATGKLMSVRRAGRRHLLGNKPARRKRTLRGPALLSPSDEKHVRPMIPYR